MAVVPFAGFVGGTYEHPLSTVSTEKCVNWIPERVPPEAAGKTQWAYRARPGLLELTTAGVGPIRAEFEQNGRQFVISGNTLYEITVAADVWTATNRGAVGTDGMRASIAGNGPQGDQLCIISNGNGFIYTLSTDTLAAIADPQFPANALQVVFWRGHFVVIPENGVTFSLSALYDGTSYVTADIGEKSLSQDFIKSVLVDEDSGELWLIGTQKTEVWWYNGALGFPAQPVNVIIPSGSAASFAWCLVGGSIYGLAQSRDGGRVVGRFQSGYGFERISHHALEATLQGYSEAQIANAVAYAFEWHGHRFFVLTIDDDATWVFDEATSLWHQWDYWDAERGVSGAFLGMGHLYVNGTHVLGSRRDGTLYGFHADYLDDDGDVIRIVRRYMFPTNGRRVPIHDITFGFQMGVGNASAESPVGMVRFSRDHATWETERQVALGAQGEYATRAQLRRCGLSGYDGASVELVITDPVIRALSYCTLDLGFAA